MRRQVRDFVGSFARDVIDGARSGRLPQCSSEGYIEIDGHWVCVANVEAGYNAVTISVRSGPGNDWLDYFKVGAPVGITPSLLSISDCRVNLSPLMPWFQLWLRVGRCQHEYGLQALTKWAPDVRFPFGWVGAISVWLKPHWLATRESDAASSAIQV
ncbi:MAG: hypothetical protein CM1200mP41_36760 [Gammaproteobacteria bacterium]|nr:MAG: hypothetical protein CM1200mP41_36760 [Gammaproteobacteria bacterium]